MFICHFNPIVADVQMLHLRKEVYLFNKGGQLAWMVCFSNLSLLDTGMKEVM